MRSGPLCALLWRILTWCTRNQVTLKARHIPGRLRLVADKLARPPQEWSLLQEVFQVICNRWHRPQIDLFDLPFYLTSCLCVTSTGSPGQSSGCAQSAMVGSGSIHLPTISHIGQSGDVAGLPMQENHSDCPGLPNIPWFWDPVAMSGQIPLSLPNLPTQPFNQIPHRNLTNLNLDARLLEPQHSRSRASLRRWQQELRLLKGDQPDQSMRQSGPLLQVVRH